MKALVSGDLALCECRSDVGFSCQMEFQRCWKTTTRSHIAFLIMYYEGLISAVQLSSWGQSVKTSMEF